LDITLKITQFRLHGLRLRLTSAGPASFFNQRLDWSLSKRLAHRRCRVFVVRMVFAQQGVEYPARVFQRMVKVHNLHTALEAVFAHVFQTAGAINEHHHLAGAAQAPAQGFLT